MDGGAAGTVTWRARALVALFLLCASAGAFFVRTRGLPATLPHRPMADEEVFVHQLQILRGELDLPHGDYRQGIYPRFVPWLASLLPVPKMSGSPLEAAGAEHVLLREVVAWISLLCVPATWFLARRFLPPFGAGVATLACAASALFAWYAPQARPHGAEAGLAPLALLACLRLAERGGVLRYIVAGCSIGLALAALHSGVLLLVPLIVAHVLRARTRVWRDAWMLAPALALAALGLLAYPYLFWHTGNAGPGVLGLVHADEGLLHPQGFERLFSGLWDFEPWLLVAGLVAFGAWIAAQRRPSGALLVLGSWFAIYVLAFGLYRHSTQRYDLPLVPLLCIASSALLCRVHWGLALALVGLQSAGALRLAELRSRPDTGAQAARWIETELPPGSSIFVLPSLVLPVRSSPDALAAGNPELAPLWIAWQMRHPPAAGEPTWRLRPLPLREPGLLQRLRDDPKGYIDALGGGLVMVELFDRPYARELLQGLRARGELVARFAPAAPGDPGEKPFLPRDAHAEYERDACWLLRAFQVQRLGVVIEVYRLPGAR